MKIPCTLLSQSDYLIQIVDTKLHTMTNIADPDQLASSFLQKQGISEYSRTRVKFVSVFHKFYTLKTAAENIL